jgi:predicted regulator of Ras-like GTPase activity (Roadblock/LC7/MglB family)
MATAKLIVLAAFDKNDEGDLVAAFDARQVDTAERSVRELNGAAARTSKRIGGSQFHARPTP